MKNNNKKPRIGIGVIVIKDNKVLLGKRKGSHGERTWNFPGGHLHFYGDIENCARREVMEEAGIKIKNLKLGPFTNDFFKKEGKHYVTLYVIAEYKSGKVKLMKPNKCEKWGWFSWNNFPKPLFTPCKNLLKQKFNPFN